MGRGSRRDAAGPVILVDTSIWIEVLRRGPGLDLESLVEFDDVVTCPPIVQEVLQGIRDPEAHALAREAMLALPMVESPFSTVSRALDHCADSPARLDRFA